MTQVLEVTNLHKAFGGIKAVNGVSFGVDLLVKDGGKSSVYKHYQGD